MDPPLIGPLLAHSPLTQAMQQLSPELGHKTQPASSGEQYSLLTSRMSSLFVMKTVWVQQSGPPQHTPPQLQYPPGQQKPRFFVAGSDGQAFGSQLPAEPSGWRLIQRPTLSRSRPLQHGLPRFRFCPAFAHSSRRFCLRSLSPPPLPRLRFDFRRLPPDPPPKSPSDPRPPATASPATRSSSAASASGLRPITAPPRTRPSAARKVPRRDFEEPNCRVKRSNALWSTVEVSLSMCEARSFAIRKRIMPCRRETALNYRHLLCVKARMRQIPRCGRTLTCNRVARQHPRDAIEKGVAGWPPLLGLLRVLVVVVARGRRRPPQLEALPAVNRLVRARLEGNLGIAATLRANRRKHLARSAGVAPATAR